LFGVEQYPLTSLVKLTGPVPLACRYRACCSRCFLYSYDNDLCVWVVLSTVTDTLRHLHRHHLCHHHYHHRRERRRETQMSRMELEQKLR